MRLILVFAVFPAPLPIPRREARPPANCFAFAPRERGCAAETTEENAVEAEAGFQDGINDLFPAPGDGLDLLEAVPDEDDLP